MYSVKLVMYTKKVTYAVMSLVISLRYFLPEVSFCRSDINGYVLVFPDTNHWNLSDV